MINKYCERCGTNTVENPDVELCTKCIDKRLNYSGLYYDTWDVARVMGLSERMVRRKAHKCLIPGKIPGIKRHLFKKDDVDKWLEAGQPVPIIPKTPTTPLQEKARAMCKSDDHSWMKDEEYDGDSYTRETMIDGHQYHINVRFVHTCYFCGHKENF